MTDHEKGNLAQGLTIVDVISIGVGSAIGVSIFSIMAPAAKVAGAGMLPALALAAIPMVVFAVVYAFMGSTVPRSGASFEWPARFIHPFVGFMVAWLRVVGNTGALILLTQVLVSYVSRAIPITSGRIAPGLRAQALRAAHRIADAIAEGCGKNSDFELARFAEIAAGSVSELSSQLVSARVHRILSQEAFKRLWDAARLLRRRINAFHRVVRRRAEVNDASSKRRKRTTRRSTSGSPRLAMPPSSWT